MPNTPRGLESTNPLDSLRSLMPENRDSDLREGSEKVEVSLPIEAFKGEILESIENNPITIITAETGAGKSTQVPQFLLDQGYEVVVTQPRRLAASSVASRISDERGEELGQTVGFKTAFEGKLSKNTKLLFCTDGLQLVKELSSKNKAKSKRVLVLDEVHEWNLNMETLVAWVKKQQDEGVDLKVVLMSATLDAERLSSYFSGEENLAPVVEVPGRLHPVKEEVYRARHLVDVAADFAKKGRNVLVFQPGKKEIDETIEGLQERGVNAEILPLHGQLDPQEQNKVFRHYGRPKIIVSTNVAQTSITIDDIDAVVDSGIERRLETKDSIEGLYLKPISKADCKQRKGRAGRCRPGIYALCSDEPFEFRTDYPLPEIERRNLAQMILKLAAHGMDATELEFYHQPDREGMLKSKESLKLLGAIDVNGDVTKMGEKMAKLPIGVNAARMLIEAEKNNCVQDVATIAACLEAGELGYKSGEWRSLTKEGDSDVLAQLDIFNWSSERRSAKEMKDKGVNKKSYYRAREIRRNLINALRKAGFKFDWSESSQLDRESIIKSVVAGMVDTLYTKKYGKLYSNGSEDERLFNDRSVINSFPEMVVGKPLDIQFRDRYDCVRDLSLLSMCTKVDVELLKEVAPHLFEEADPVLSWDSVKEHVIQEQGVKFNGQRISPQIKPAEKNKDTRRITLRALCEGSIYLREFDSFNYDVKKLKEEVKDLEVRANGELSVEVLDLIVSRLENVIDCDLSSAEDICSLLASGDLKPEDLKFTVSDLIGSEKVREIRTKYPDFVTLPNGHWVDIEYATSWAGQRKVVLNFGINDVSEVSQDWLESLGLSENYQLSIKGEFDSAENLSELKKIAGEIAWRKFNLECPTKFFESANAVKLPKPMVYNKGTGAMAYPYADKRWDGGYALKWTKSEKEAGRYNEAILSDQRLEDRVGVVGGQRRGSLGDILAGAISSVSSEIDSQGSEGVASKPSALNTARDIRKKTAKTVAPQPEEVSISEMSEDRLYEELGSIEERIVQINEENPDMEEIFTRLKNAKAELASAEEKRNKLSEQKDLITGPRRSKIISKFNEAKLAKKVAKERVSGLEKVAKKMMGIKKELDQLVSRKEAIESHLESL